MTALDMNLPSTHRPRRDRADREPHAGMPPLDTSGPALSHFEFWPGYLFYAPVGLLWAFLAAKYRSATLATIANPLFPHGGLMGESKADVLDTIAGDARSFVAPFVTHIKTGHDDSELDFQRAKKIMMQNGLSYPIVAKPDLGMRGIGVRPVRNDSDLRGYLDAFPHGNKLLLQKMIPFDGEAGVFYVRLPGEDKGQVLSLTLKYFPHVTGDGKSTLEELIHADPRAGRIPHIYLERHKDSLQMVLPTGQPFRLAFAGSHSRGTIFKNGNDFITHEMTNAFDRIAKEIPEFYFGRFDVRFEDIEDLQNGHGFSILEVNGAGGEATHIWDSKTRLIDAYRSLFRQHSLLFKIGDRNRARGFRPTKAWDLMRAILKESSLTKAYPSTQ